MPLNIKNNMMPDSATLKADSLKINEIFYSIQGESTYAGYPCIFIRFSSCNLRCNYCDTDYAFYEGKEYKIFEIMEQIKQYPTKLVEITGGEPLIQTNVHQLIDQLIKHKYDILLETGGHLDISSVHKNVKIILDIKCPSSGESEKNLWSNLEHINPGTEIKFVIGERNDFDWAVKILKTYHLTDKNPVLFSPVFKKINNEDLAEWILQSGLPVRMQLQMHKYIWHPYKRGV